MLWSALVCVGYVHDICLPCLLHHTASCRVRGVCSGVDVVKFLFLVGVWLLSLFTLSVVLCYVLLLLGTMVKQRHSSCCTPAGAAQLMPCHPSRPCVAAMYGCLDQA